MKQILALTKYGVLAASTRQRFLQFRDALAEASMQLSISPFFGDDHVARIGKDRGSIVHAIEAYGRRLHALAAERADLLWVHCESLPYLPGFFERAVFLRQVPVVFDYDDAIFHNYDRHSNRIARWILGRKLTPIIDGADAVVAGNEYLRAFASQWNDRTIIVPTVVDTDSYVPASERTGSITVGWIGSPTTWEAYVRPMLGPIAEACQSRNAKFLVVGAGQDERPRFDRMEVRDWSEEREIAYIQEMDIGIMPLPDDPWARGKCGYKLIQYMACGIPTVASPVGVNVDLADGGKSGLLASTPDEWKAALGSLIDDPQRRKRMGAHGRALVEKDYSLKAQAPRIVGLFRDLLGD